MTVLKMSAQQTLLSAIFRFTQDRKRAKNLVDSTVRSSPKAEVRGSNPFGRASALTFWWSMIFSENRFALFAIMLWALRKISD